MALRWAEIGNLQRSLEVVKSINSLNRDSALKALIEQLTHSPGASLLDEMFGVVRHDIYSFSRDYLFARLIPFLAEEGDSERALQEARSLQLPNKITALLERVAFEFTGCSLK
jgi:hypothetical protein